MSDKMDERPGFEKLTDPHFPRAKPIAYIEPPAPATKRTGTR